MAAPSWQIKEPLQVAWDQEYLFLEVPEDLADARSVQGLTDGSRVFATQYDPARDALVTCLDVTAGEELSLTLTEEVPADTGLQVERLPGVLVLRNAHCAGYFAAEAQVEDAGDHWVVSGPIAYLQGPDGLPRGASRLVVNKSRFFPHDQDSIARVDAAKIAAEDTPPTVEIALEEEGSVFARYRYQLTLFDGRTYEFTATLYADYPIFFIREETNLDREGNLEIEVTHNFGCDLYFFGGVDNHFRQSQVPIPPYEYRLGSLTPHHTQGHTAYPWLGFMQSDRPQGSFRGIRDTALESYADVLLFMAYQPSEWLYPSEITLQFDCEEGRRVVVRGPLRRGLRTWCLFVTGRAEVRRSHSFQYDEETRVVSTFTLWHRKLNDLPFDWVRRLDLTSGALEANKLPQSVLTKEEFTAKRQGIFQELANLLAEKIASDQPSALYARWMLTGEEAAARRLAQYVINETEAKLALFLNSGFLADAASAVSLRVLGPTAMFYEACVAAGVISEEQADRLRTLMLLFAHAAAGDALFPSHCNYLPPDHPKSIRNWSTVEQYSDLFGTPNFQTDVYYNLGLYGAVFSEHPQAQAWRAEAAQQLDDQLEVHFHPGGVYKESILYFSHMFHNMLSLAGALKRHGSRDFFADQRFQGAMECLVDYLGAPRRPTVERLHHQEDAAGSDEDQLRRYLPAIGDTGGDCMEQPLPALVAQAAWEVREHNPELSDRLLAAWKECGRRLWGPNSPQFEYLYVQDLDPQGPPLELAPRTFVNVGHLLRADVGLPSETSIFLRSGRATHHWGFEHGHFQMLTRGSLLMPDFGYHGETEPGGEQLSGSATWLHNVVTFGPYWNGDTGMERRPGERLIKLDDQFDYVVCDLSMNNFRVQEWRNLVPIVPIEYFRHFLFAHNRYVFVWDRIDFSVYSSQLRIHCLAESVSIEGSRLHFQGLDEVDLVVNVIAPESPEFHEGLVGPQRYVMCQQDCQRDYVWVCQPLGPGESEFTVTNAPNLLTIKGTDLRGMEFEDHLVYAEGDFGATVSIEGQTYCLDGRLALIHREQAKQEVRLLEARSLAPVG